MKNKVICTVITDDYIKGGLVLLYSLKKNFKLIDEFDIKVFYDNEMEYGKLSIENQEHISFVRDFGNTFFQTGHCHLANTLIPLLHTSTAIPLLQNRKYFRSLGGLVTLPYLWTALSHLERSLTLRPFRGSFGKYILKYILK